MIARPDLSPAHHFTVDIEEYFQVSAFESRVSRDDWNGFKSRVAPTVCRIVDLPARAAPFSCWAGWRSATPVSCAPSRRPATSSPPTAGTIAG